MYNYLSINQQSEELSLYKFFEELKLDLYLTKPQINHLENIMNATLSNGYKGKVSDVASSTSQRHRTSITRFFHAALGMKKM